MRSILVRAQSSKETRCTQIFSIKITQCLSSSAAVIYARLTTAKLRRFAV